MTEPLPQDVTPQGDTDTEVPILSAEEDATLAARVQAQEAERGVAARTARRRSLASMGGIQAMAALMSSGGIDPTLRLRHMPAGVFMGRKEYQNRRESARLAGFLPHQGKRELARRQRQLAGGQIKGAQVSTDDPRYTAMQELVDAVTAPE